MTKVFSIIYGLALIFVSSASLSATDESLQKLLDDETKMWVVALQSESGEELKQTALALQDSGIDSPELFDAAKTVVLEEHARLNSKSGSSNSKYILSSLARFLAGSSNFEHLEALDTLTVESSSGRVANLAKTLKTRISWYQNRNSEMNNFSNHIEGNSLHTTRFINLISSENHEFRRYAAESLTRLNNYDKQFTDIMAEKIKEEYKSPGTGTQLDSVAWYLRFLGREGSYTELLNEVASYKQLDKKLKKHVRMALQGK